MDRNTWCTYYLIKPLENGISSIKLCVCTLSNVMHVCWHKEKREFMMIESVNQTQCWFYLRLTSKYYLAKEHNCFHIYERRIMLPEICAEYSFVVKCYTKNDETNHRWTTFNEAHLCRSELNCNASKFVE